MKKYLVEVIIIIMIIFMVFWAYIKFTVTEQVKLEPWKPYQPFAIIVEETTWDGKLEPGKYNKNGIKISKQ